MSEKLIITVAPTGDTKIKVEGHAGPGCADLTAAIEKALGETVKDERTPEFHERPIQENRRATVR